MKFTTGNYLVEITLVNMDTSGDFCGLIHIY